ncbi:uncharacterized protein LOC114021903 isoform X1 [Chelonia mydas]|uniref:uncharacterized protein LOC114021903 isoform X1 n=1 Tax=Chelonia mydas TaxID=8469 RepID=UPI001CA7BC41|nr:uncharacterized protein LOC114021903 isoform X1 [Chelonia mydas]XP_043381025.1 uncharacterized protein LOC114021903 isoform X1 [Chelonia mydas]XP_043381026.1 uncharacterized protein LOC114021903 isoform X1 [Chelonia mydas]XP_043381027.1 uncharacterized protein LOC114021903 isoform X1 [Chelonia mydas]
MAEPEKKRIRRLCSFKDEWLQLPEYRNWLSKASEESGYCSICRVQFKIQFDSVKAIQHHAETAGHEIKVRAQVQSSIIDKFFILPDTSEEEQVCTAELLLTYHGVKHHHSYHSQDCGNKLYPSIFTDSKIASKIHCGRTKAEALIENVLAPHSLKLAVQDIGSASFSIVTDAWNKGNTKLFPVALHYFNKDKGSCTCVLDFFEDADETSEAIANNIRSCLQNAGLIHNKIVAYGADNASVNFGKHKSVLVHLKQMLDLPNLVPGHCSTHIVHNTAKHGLKMLSYDVENLVIKVFSEFSSSAKNVSELKEFFDFLETDYSEILRHVPTHFLTLFTAVDRLLKHWPALKSYFVKKGEEKVSCAIWAFLSEQEDAVSDDDIITLPELYVYFVHNILSQFNNTIKVLESDYVQVTELYGVFNRLRREIQNRQEQGFYGYKVTQFLKKLPPNEQNKFVGDAQRAYTRMLQYLEKWFDFSENSFYVLCAPLNLDGPLELDKLCALTANWDIQVDGDELFTEMCSLNDALPALKSLTNDAELPLSPQQQECHRRISVSEVWVEFFKRWEAPNLLKIVQHVLAVPPTNAFVERVFSVMKNLRMDERNRPRVDLVKAELFVHFNYTMTCAEFAGFLKTKAAKELVVGVRQDRKCEPGEGMVSENVEENPQQEDPEQVETHGTLLGRSEGTVSWSPEHGKAGGSQCRPERQQGNQPGKNAGKSTQRDGGSKNLSKNMMHQRSSKGERKNTCTECGKSFSRSLYLIIHRRTHTGERPHKCLQCGKSFIGIPTLKKHQKIHTREKPYKCPDCGKSFGERSHLIGHQRVHTEAKTFICSQCGETFCNWSSFLRHERIHTGERSKPHKCPECGENFRDRTGLIRHQTTHTGEKPYTCLKCGESFSRRSNLTRHQKVHTGERPYKCLKCGKSFSQKSTRSRHLRTHWGESE